MRSSPAPLVALLVTTSVALLAVASLALPGAPGYDAWAWLIWGRELASGTLDTSAGASWKPLTSLIAAPLSLLGDEAPDVWLVIARIGWIGAVVLAGELARRLAADVLRLSAAPAIGAALLAALGVAMIGDAFTSWPRQALLGLSEPLLVALVLLAAERELADRRTAAIVVAWIACLVRPEVWPFFALYLLYAVTARRRAGKRLGGVVAALVALAALAGLWFIPDLVGSGDALEGALRARDASGPPVGEFFEAIGRGLALAIPALWIGALAALYAERQEATESSRAVRLGRIELGPVALLALLAAGWVGVVAAMAAGGYPGLPRFMAPAGAIACVLGGCGIAWLLAAGGRTPMRLAGGALMVATLALAVPRAIEFGDEVERAETVAESNASLDRLTTTLERVDRDCGRVTTTDFLYLTAISWRLEVSPSQVELRRRPPVGRTGLVSSDVTATPRELRDAGARPIALAGRWGVYAIDCATRSRSSSSSPDSGGRGGRR
ncbi:hypothetical protein HJD18_02375 [Thermoleophilia bacterium SCSIO 60948]|nr:hypothetical protein HJD18_02375 [Thermoleophilia bacterium SCSIO 60948]